MTERIASSFAANSEAGEGVVVTATLPVPLVTAVPVFPAVSLKAILKVVAPDVSLALTVYAAVQVFPEVFVYVMEVSAIAAPPDSNVTVGVDIASLAVNVRVTTSPSFATEVIALFEAMLTELSVGAVPSYVQLNCVAAVLLFPAASVNVLEATSTVVAPAPLGVKVAV